MPQTNKLQRKSDETGLAASASGASSAKSASSKSASAKSASAKAAGRARQQKEWCADNPRADAHRAADLARRLGAAGIDPQAEPPEDMDEFRRHFARYICMFVNDWRGCPLRLCRRMHGCMAPESQCANHADDPPMTREEWDVARVDIRRALDERIAACGGRDAFEAAARDEFHKKS